MITIHLNDLKFHSFHGLYEEEKILGNDFIINASVDFREELTIITSINDTINYINIYNIIEQRMEMPTPLLETVIMEMGNEIRKQFQQINSIKISIFKMHPPVKGMQGNVGVTWQKQF